MTQTVLKSHKPSSQEKLPKRLSLLSKSGLVLLPGTTLPLMVTQASMLQLVQEVVKKDLFIGVVQPQEKEGNPLFQSGCLGRISTFSETENGFFIVITGLCRFSVDQELRTTKPYRKALVSYHRFALDLEEKQSIQDVDRPRLLKALRRYLKTHDIVTDWRELEKVPDDHLVTMIALTAPFGPQEKQAILELPTLAEQCCLATTLIEIGLLDSLSLPLSYH